MHRCSLLTPNRESKSSQQSIRFQPRAVGHTLTAENKNRDEVKYDIGYEFELNRESKRLNIFAILGFMKS